MSGEKNVNTVWINMPCHYLLNSTVIKAFFAQFNSKAATRNFRSMVDITRSGSTGVRWSLSISVSLALVRSLRGSPATAGSLLFL
ncbi:hypothetical protein Z043_100748 [Scleropages formosus]|uniref:Uncharacterized protein n=1 Tax=Scleropages formosus TaxID=113540 RepID=A0A0P7VZY2_SCLFO|nr:hypothetical protein Z043_100748 [Scleropages formosus]